MYPKIRYGLKQFIAKDRQYNQEDLEKEEKGTMTVNEALHKGGEAVKKEYGLEFYSNIAHEEGEAVIEKYGSEHMAEIGIKGDEARHEDRRLQATDEQTRENVARAGGEAYHGRGGSNGSSIESIHEKKAEAVRKGGEH
jgi:general stress protein YciG